MNTAIKVENLSKVYVLGEFGTGTLSLDFQRWLMRIQGKDDPYLTIGEVNDRMTKGGNVIFSLQDINFNIDQGDAVGIIGRNGAGKSTLLKILSRITSPTRGRIHLKGRVASLLEVGTGFHPELTGRENIYLNGAIMGMRKKEIEGRLDEIIDFSGVERYIDTPVKRYSSGMYVRLAFAVAAHLESEILIVDEVLAVGDAEFQKKCLGKMGEVREGDGRTVLFVSHNLTSINALCNKGILLSQGKLIKQGPIQDVIFNYKKIMDEKNGNFIIRMANTSSRILLKADLNLEGVQPNKFIELNLTLNTNFELKNSMLVVDILNSDGICLFQSVSSLKDSLEKREAQTDITARIHLSGIVIDFYTVNVYICDSFFVNLDFIKDALFFEIMESPIKEKLSFEYRGTENGFIYPITEIIRRN